MNINEIAAQWWADRFEIKDKREELKEALLKHLPDGDWKTYNDYDPDGPLLLAVSEVTECRGFMFSGDGLFPRKTGLHRRGDILVAKEGYGADWIVVNAELHSSECSEAERR